ncbi:30S ribosomal protein S8 [Candidatus Uhrbacteria bacterium RIFCSPHIGHO2_02_FULL_60_10]|uniref:Small ribosomal subunit protein uS8 n=1 Tax=Candidatus Uhrbacteria bacterium RIFCSPHIGHO2_02_FULL_60_10 TaxID=1802392 RepID=A0A1F7U2J7_9BACT|nr:MAG: 30S ribosomal protein S8 [Candidatus Uhrbacteria bacterium RIFCSPHIGHO2_02_FULL_60_10]
MITDPISDMLTRIRNASMVRKTEVMAPFSKVKLAIAGILAAEGYVQSVEREADGQGQIRIKLKYDKNESAIRHIRRVSKPGGRAYAGYADLPRVLSDRGIAIVSTSQGIMTNKDARKRKLGGEVLCEIY